jgi:hypothetical protein
VGRTHLAHDLDQRVRHAAFDVEAGGRVGSARQGSAGVQECIGVPQGRAELGDDVGDMLSGVPAKQCRNPHLGLGQPAEAQRGVDLAAGQPDV